MIDVALLILVIAIAVVDDGEKVLWPAFFFGPLCLAIVMLGIYVKSKLSLNLWWITALIIASQIISFYVRLFLS